VTDSILPTEYCDVVMKGGVTSGVIYPMTVVELSQKYTFKNVGGTSAGAIAAAVTAAAEYRRRQGSGEGFKQLAALPKILTQPGFLLSLFAADPPTRPILAAVRSVSESSNPFVAALRLWWALVSGFRISSIVGAVIGAIVPFVLWRMGYTSARAAIVLGTLWVLAAMTLSALVAAALTLPSILRRNNFGLASGYRAGGRLGDPPLMNWFYDFLNQVAGLPASQPLTFRHLHEAPLGNDVTGSPRVVNLEMMTTNLTHGRPHRLPFPENEAPTFYFSPVEWARLFPPEVIEHLKRLPQSPDPKPRNAENLELYGLPTADLPVIVGVRMSLSFPGLFSAVPLWSVDFTLKKNQNLPPGTPPEAERCWFSDGGLSSNFPVHLFDGPLPRWPTFAINLKPPHPDHPDEEDFVFLPSSNVAGLQPRWNRFDDGSSAHQIGGFVGALIDSMQSWRDNLAARMPGYRNRIVHIAQKPSEGGLNLSMDPEVIKKLSDRGQLAGVKLRTEFDFNNHVWVRYRVFVSSLWEEVRKFARAYEEPMPQDGAAWKWIRGDAPPPPFPSYKLDPPQASELATLTKNVVLGIDAMPEPGAIADSPRPRPELRQVPRV